MIGISFELETQLLWWGSSESNCVVNASFNHDWESLETLLTGVEAIPSVIHETVECIDKASFWGLDN
jgi:hypothetical protein